MADRLRRLKRSVTCLISWVKERLAHYKAPKRVLQVDTVGRSPSGKVDYKGLKQLALRRLGLDAR